MTYEITGRADGTSTRAGEFTSALHRLFDDFDLDKVDGTDTLAAWFLGPLAENEELFGNLMQKAVKSHCDDRRKFYPQDPVYVTEDIKNSPGYEYSVRVLTDEVDNLLGALRGSVPFFSYRYQSHMNWDLTLPSIVGYFAAMLYSPNNVAAEASPVTTLLEKAVGEDLCRMLGYDPSPKGNPQSWGHITCDGSVANIEALWSARNLKYYPISVAHAIRCEPDLEEARRITVTLPDGYTVKKLVNLTTWECLNLRVDEVLNLTARMVDDYEVPYAALEAITKYSLQTLGYEKFAKNYIGNEINPPVVFAPVTLHYSWPKAAALLGIGQDNLIPIDVDLDARAKTSHLRTLLDQCELDHRPVLLDVAVLGNTEQSSVDPLAAMIKMREEYYRRNIAYPIHVDAAWGGYFAAITQAIKRESTVRATNGEPRFTPELSMSTYVNEQYNALPLADSITIDPHKAGYIPYPAGSLCYRNKSQRDLVAFTAPYVAHDEGVDQSVGFYGVEGSKPGAAAAGVYLSHRVIALDQRGYGRILGQSLFNSKRLYSAIVTMEQENDPFIVVPCQRLPAEKKHPGDKEKINEDLRLIRTKIVGLNNEIKNEDIYNNKELLPFFRELGSDQIIIAYVFNFYEDDKKTRLNKSIKKLNDLNRQIFQKLSLHPADAVKCSSDDEPPPPPPPLIVTGSQFKPKIYKEEYMARLRERLGVEGGPDEPIEYLISTTMDPWMTDTSEGNFIPKLIDALRETVTTTINEIKNEADARITNTGT
ncbi:MAG: pyridoxal phosphate-dependent decarboxylase family protein [Pseudonocardiaceae bacterium]